MMGGKVSVITLNPDMTFRERKKRTDIDNVDISKHDKPDFVIGRSVFRELRSPLKRLLGKKPRNLLIHVAGANSCFELNRGDFESHVNHLWSRKEKEKYIDKLALKSKAEGKAIESWQFFVLAGLAIVVLVFQILILSGSPISA